MGPRRPKIGPAAEYKVQYPRIVRAILEGGIRDSVISRGFVQIDRGAVSGMLAGPHYDALNCIALGRFGTIVLASGLGSNMVPPDNEGVFAMGQAIIRTYREREQ